MVSNVQLQNALDSLKSSITDCISDHKRATDQNNKELMEKIDIISNRITVLEERTDSLTEDVAVLTERVENDKVNSDVVIEQLKVQVGQLLQKVAVLEQLPVKVDHLKELNEERTNRQLRETLIFKNIPESHQEETYADTKKILAEVISVHCDIPVDQVIRDIKRAHRESKKRPHAEGNSREGKRHIYVAFHSWDLPQKVLEIFRQKNIQDRSFKIYAEQKYGPLTNKRRNLALQKRRELLDANLISGGYIAFPARLMVNFGNMTNAAGHKMYKCHTDFSSHVIE